MTEKTIVVPPAPGGNGADASYRLTVMAPKRRYFSYLRNRWWVVVICVAVAVGCVVAYETVRQETYSSYAQLYVTVGPQLGGSIFAEPKDDFATQIELLKGSRLRRAALARLGPETTSQLKGGVDVEVVRPMGTTILQLKATSADPNVSQRFLQALIDEFLDFKKQTRLQTAEDLVGSLNDELARRDATLKEGQEKWAAFQKTNNVTLIVEEAKTSGSYLADLKTQLQRLTLERQLLEEGLDPWPLAGSTNAATSTNALATTRSSAATNAVAASATNTLASISTTNGLADATNAPPPPSGDLELKNARIQLTLRRAEREQTFNDHGAAAVRGLDDDITRLERTIAALEGADAAQRRTGLDDLDKRIAAMQANLPEVEASLKNANDLLSQAQLIKDDLQRQQSYYDNLLAMLRNVDFTKNMAQERVTLLEPPSPGQPSQRSLAFRVVLAIAAGLFVALGLVFLWYLLDDRLVSIHDLKDQFGETLLGLVPRVSVPKSRPGAALLSPGDTRAGYLESYRHLRSALMLSPLGQGRPQTLLFSGAIPAEGKTTIAINLARLLAQHGLRVALVDADLRGGRIHQLLGRENGPGLANFLRGEAGAGAVIHPTDQPGLSFVSAGSTSHADDQFLSHPSLGDLMKELKTDRDFVIVDGPPILAVDDASLLVPYADAVVMVMRPFFTRTRQARRALEMLYQRQARQVVLILNQARTDDLAGQYYARNGKSHAAKNGKS